MLVRLAKLAMTDHDFVNAIKAALLSRKGILADLSDIYAIHEFEVRYDDKTFVIDLTAHRERHKHLIYLFIVYPVLSNGRKARRDCGSGWIDSEILHKALEIEE